MRILVLNTDGFGGHGGIALYNRDLLTALCEIPECTEVVALPRLMPKAPESMPDKLNWMLNGLGGKGRYLKALATLLLCDRKFDLIVCAHLNLLPAGFLAKVSTRAPLLLEIYGVEAWQPSKSRLVNHLVGYCEAVTSISAISRERFLSWAKIDAERVCLLPNAIHLDWYSPGPVPDYLLDRYGLRGKKVLLTVGRLVSKERYKGFDEVLEVLPDMPDDIVYLVVGDGDDRSRLEMKAKSLGVAERVIFTGWVPEEEKADHFRASDLYVMPSRGEGFGFVFLEALACGVPCIGSREDGGREALRDGLLGELVSSSDQSSLRDAVVRGLKGAKGMVPEGLAYFAFEKFCQRVRRVVENLTMKLGGLH